MLTAQYKWNQNRKIRTICRFNEMSCETFVTGQFRLEVTHFFTAAGILAPLHDSRDHVPPRARFQEQLAGAQRANRSLLCVGLDPLPEAMPNAPRNAADVLAFCCAVVDAVADVVSAFKPQHAHFAALGAEAELAALVRYVHECHSGVPVILDAKRGDVGSTAERYAVEAFDRYGADAVTVNPYLGPESLQPFLRRVDRGTLVLCRTSNPESAWLQGYPSEDPVYLRVARAARDWNAAGNVLLVVGATYPDELRRIRAAVGDMTLLVPGVGAQGGDVEAVIDAGLNCAGDGLIINASRSVLYASRGADFAQAARDAAVQLREQINAARSSVR
jgi:orotidine-5'-phosphate decarboxylase